MNRFKFLIVSALLSLALSGTVQADVGATPTSVDWGDVTIGNKRSEGIKLGNYGDVPITILKFEIRGGPFWFEIDEPHGPCYAGAVWQPIPDITSNCVAFVHFEATRPGHYVAFLLITYMAEDTKAIQVVAVRFEADGIK